MRRHLQNLLYISLISLSFSQNLDITSIYPHPETAGMGFSGIAHNKNAASSFINPSLLGGITEFGGYGYSATFEGEIYNSNYTLYFPLIGNTFSFSYFLQSANDIPITQFIDSRIRANGSFGANITQYKMAIGRQFADFFLLKDFSLGYSAGIQQYSFSGDNDMFQRLGTSFTTQYNDNLYFASIFDLNESSFIGTYGLFYDQPKYRANLDLSAQKIRTGVEYDLSNYFKVRTGYEPRYLTFGLGLTYDKISGPFNINLAMSLDYAYLMPINDYFSPYSYFSFALKEQDKMQIPIIYKYPSLVNKDKAYITGWADKNSTIILYNKNSMIEKTKANENGQWECTIPIKEYTNIIKARSLSELSNKNSDFSREIQIIKDTTSPIINVIAKIIRNTIMLEIYPNEILKQDPVIKTKTGLYSVAMIGKKYQTKLNTSKLGAEVCFEVVDLAENISELKVKSPFIDFISPEQKLIVTNKENYFFNGIVDRFSELKITNHANGFGTSIKLQKIGQFEQSIPLAYGKNIIAITENRPNIKITYPFEVIRIFNFRDNTNEDINKLATIGVIDQDDLFKAEQKVTQKSLITWLIRFKEIKLENEDLNTTYSFAQKEKWINNRDDNQLISRREAMEIIARALPLNIHSTQKENSYFANISLDNPNLKTINYMVEHGFISNNNKNYELNNFITKGEFIFWLTRTDQMDILNSHFFKENTELDF